MLYVLGVKGIFTAHGKNIKDISLNPILNSLYKQKQKNRSVVTYWKTIQCVADYNKVPKDKVRIAVDGLIKQKYLYKEDKKFKRGKVVSILKADWDKISNDGIWEKE